MSVKTNVFIYDNIVKECQGTNSFHFIVSARVRRP